MPGAGEAAQLSSPTGGGGFLQLPNTMARRPSDATEKEIPNGVGFRRRGSDADDVAARRRGSDGDLPSAPSHDVPGLSPANGDRKARWERVRDMAFPKRSGSTTLASPATLERPVIHWHAIPILLPDGPFRRVWDTILIVALLYSFMTVPYYIAWDTQASGGLEKLEILLDIFFIIDLLLNFRTAYIEPLSNEMIIRGPDIAKRYARGWLVVDLLSSVPFDIITTAAGNDFGLTFAKVPRMLRLLRLFRLIRFIVGGPRSSFLEKLLDVLQINPVILRVFKLFFWIALVAHINACVIFFVARMEDFPPNCWVYSRDALNFDPTEPSVDSYILAFYFVFTTMATVGYGDITPGNTVERLITILIEFSGSITFGFVVGGIGNVVQALNRNATRYQAEMDAITEYMRYRGLPRDLQERIKKYFEYIMARQLLFDEKAILAKLSTSLRTEVCLYLNRDMIEKTPFFRGKDPNFIAAVVTSLRPMSVAPGDYIFRFGETGREMYILSKGRVEVVGPENKRYNVLEAGSYFGEVSLLLGVKRTASTRAIGHCDLFALTKEDLDRATDDYPREKKKLEDIARSRVAQLQVDDRKKDSAPTPPPPPPPAEEAGAGGGGKSARSTKSRSVSARRRRQSEGPVAGDAAALVDEGMATTTDAEAERARNRSLTKSERTVLQSVFRKAAGAFRRRHERPGDAMVEAVGGAVEHAVKIGAMRPRSPSRPASDDEGVARLPLRISPPPAPAQALDRAPLSERRARGRTLPPLDIPGGGRPRPATDPPVVLTVTGASMRSVAPPAPGEDEGQPSAPPAEHPLYEYTERGVSAGAVIPAVTMAAPALPADSPDPRSFYTFTDGGAGPAFHLAPLHGHEPPAPPPDDEHAPRAAAGLAASPSPPGPALSSPEASPSEPLSYPVPGSIPPGRSLSPDARPHAPEQGEAHASPQ